MTTSHFFTGTPDSIEKVEGDLKRHQGMVVEDALPPPCLVRKGFFDLLLPH